METKRLRCANAALALCIASTPVIVRAQTFSPEYDALSEGPEFDRVEEIHVTARRKEENVMSTPVTVTALSASALETRSVFEASDLQEQVPTLLVNPTTAFGQPQFTLNGIRSEFPTGITITGPSVVTYINEVPQDTEQLLGGVWDMESVQVLLGPQGTLFGQSSTAGAILFATKRPTNDFGGTVDIRYGNYNERAITAGLNLPMNDWLKVRLAGRYEENDGYVKSPGANLDSKDIHAARVSVLMDPAASFRNLLIVDTLEVHNRNNPGFITAALPCLPTTPGRAACLFSGNPGSLSPGVSLASLIGTEPNFQSAGVTPGTDFDHSKTQGMSNVTTLDAGAIGIKNILGYRDVHPNISADVDGTALPVFLVPQQAHITQTSDEVQVTGTGLGDALSLQAGAIYLEEKQRDFQEVVKEAINLGFPTILTANILNGPGSNATTKGAYGQATYDMEDWVKGLRFTGGYRYTWWNQSMTVFNPGGSSIASPCPSVFGPLCILAPIGPAATTISTFSAPNYSLSGDYQIDKNLFVYASFAHGANAGFHNVEGTQPPQLSNVLPESDDHFEAGIKSNLEVGGPIRLQVSLHRDNFKNMQRGLILLVPGAGSLQYTVNAASTVLQGATIQVDWLPLERLSVSAYYALNDARFTNFTIPGLTNENPGYVGQPVPGFPLNLTGQTVSGAPKQTANLLATYTFVSNEDLGKVSATASAYFLGTRAFSDVQEIPGDTAVLPLTYPSVMTFDARIDWKQVRGTYADIGLYVRNLSDRHYAINDLVNGGLDYVIAYYGDPRTFGVEVRYRFGNERWARAPD